MLQFLLTLTDESNHGKIEHIYNTYHEYMMRCAVTNFRNKGRKNAIYDAEDAVQNAYMKIAKYIDNIDFSRGEKDVKNYCLSILTNEIHNILRSNKENFEFDEEICDENAYNFIEELEIKERYDEVLRAIEELDEKYSTTLYLAFFKEMSPNGIADMMGISAKTVYTRLERGKRLLLEALKGAKIDG